MLAHFLLIISIRKGIPNAAKRSVKAEGKSPRTPRKSISKESVSKATSELNNLLQIISLVAFETDSFEMDLRGVRGDLPSAFTLRFAAFAMPFLIEIIRRKCANMTRPQLALVR